MWQWTETAERTTRFAALVVVVWMRRWTETAEIMKPENGMKPVIAAQQLLQPHIFEQNSVARRVVYTASRVRPRPCSDSLDAFSSDRLPRSPPTPIFAATIALGWWFWVGASTTTTASAITCLLLRHLSNGKGAHFLFQSDNSRL